MVTGPNTSDRKRLRKSFIYTIIWLTDSGGYPLSSSSSFIELCQFGVSRWRKGEIAISVILKRCRFRSTRRGRGRSAGATWSSVRRRRGCGGSRYYRMNWFRSLSVHFDTLKWRRSKDAHRRHFGLRIQFMAPFQHQIEFLLKRQHFAYNKFKDIFKL